MNRIEQLENEKRAWSVSEVAAFLGYAPNYVYELIHKNEIGGWFVAKDGAGYRFCPCELAKWLRKKLEEGNGNGNAQK
jgi:excisionase family DNA binding protein